MARLRRYARLAIPALALATVLVGCWGGSESIKLPCGLTTEALGSTVVRSGIHVGSDGATRIATEYHLEFRNRASADQARHSVEVACEHRGLFVAGEEPYVTWVGGEPVEAGAAKTSDRVLQILEATCPDYECGEALDLLISWASGPRP